MILGDPPVDASVSVSSLLNKTEQRSPEATTEVLVREASITVQETTVRDDEEDNAYKSSRADKRAASVDLDSDHSARLPPSPKSADDNVNSATGTEDTQTQASVDQAKDAPEDMPEQDPEPIASPSLSARAPSPAVPHHNIIEDHERADDDDEKPLVNGADVADEKLDNDEPAAPEKEDAPVSKAESPARDTPSQAREEKTAAKPAPEDNIYEIDSITAHRVNKELSTVELFVEWVGTTSWEPERELQMQVPNLIFEYWEGQGGREKATGLQEFHVFRILDSTNDPATYRVQWVGYPDTPKDTTWESKALLRRVAPIALGLYEASNKKRPTKGKPGRPRKKVKITRDSER
jgi:hypothetical protein